MIRYTLKNNFRIVVMTLVLSKVIFSFKAYGFNGDTLYPVQIASNMLFTEGPVWHPNGYLVFSDINANVIYKWNETLGLDTLVSPSGNSNGIACTKTNDFIVCRHTSHDIAKMDTNGNFTSLLSQYNGKRLNSPNDVVLSYLGSVYFTDPDYGVLPGDRELSFQGLFCIPYNSSVPVLLDSTLDKPNGLTFVEDWRTLYVCETGTNTIYTYFLRDEYKIQDVSKDKNVFLTLGSDGEIDGITSDIFGNIYVAFGNGGVKIFNNLAQQVGSVVFPSNVKVRNLCIGGKYNNILFITAGTSLYKVDLRFYGDFIAPGLLGVPTNNSVIFNALSDKNMEAYIAYGTDSLNLTSNTSSINYVANTPIEIKISGLATNTRYYYQLFYKISGASSFSGATKGKFHTQRTSGGMFSFAVEADPHLDEASNIYTFRNTLKNAYNLAPDFLIDLGDNFLTEKFPIVDQYYFEQRNLLYRAFWDDACRSMPLFIANGNHEGELGWRTSNEATDMFNLSNTIRKIYYPNPIPDAFYSGSSVDEPFVGKRENYFAWNWGDALFVVIDPYTYVQDRTNDPWCFSLGKTQYDWFRNTLEGSNAKFKFVFAHQLVGGDALGRGGVEFADYYENGGKNSDGTYGFDIERPGWGKPLHQLMVENGVQIYFHGHDHLYAEQEKDGVIYQEVPQPSFPGYTVADDAATYGYLNGTIMPNSGHLNVNVMGDSAVVDYIGGYHIDIPKRNQINGQIRRSYSVKAKTNPLNINEGKKVASCSIYCSSSQVYINASQKIEGVVRLYSVLGQQIATIHQGVINEGVNGYTLPNSLAKGVYVISLESEYNKITYKIVI